MEKYLIAIFIASVSLCAYAQTDSTTSDLGELPTIDLTNLSLEDLMEVKIVSASKKSESLFDAPLSASSISKDEIRKAGCTNIIDALKLMPGLIVREHTNGYADVHIRGLDNVPPGAYMSQANNSTTLVMIDGRPVYNYFNGGTFWETLPVDLNDIETIELVRGASTAMYGPNAATGVINIITRKLETNGVHGTANVMGGGTGGGLGNTGIINGSVGYKKDKFDVIVSGNYQQRQRFEDKYFGWQQGEKVSSDQLLTYSSGAPVSDSKGVSNYADRYPDPSLAQEKVGYNAFVNYAVSEKVKTGLSVGGQQSTVQGAFSENLSTPLSTRKSTSNYANLKGEVYGLTAQVAYQFGTQDASKGFSGYKYDFSTLDATAEYDITFKRFSFKPGFNYRSASYSDSKYSNAALREGFLNGQQTLNDVAGSFRVEYDDKKMLRLIGAVRVDKYNAPGKAYPSYQFAANLKVNEANLLRATYSRAFRGPTMLDTYANQSLNIGSSQVAPGVFLPLYASYVGDNNLKLQQVDVYELGYRVKATDFLHFDVDGFYQVSENYNTLVQVGAAVPRQDFSGVDVAEHIVNINLKAEQVGATIGANFVWKNFQLKPFITLQQTSLTNVPKAQYADSINIKVSNISNYNGSPSAYGGFFANYTVKKKLNFNVTGYYFAPFTYTGFVSSLDLNPTVKSHGVVNTHSKFSTNIRISYKFFGKLDLFVNARNVFDQTSQEFAQTDITRALYMIGANFEF